MEPYSDNPTNTSYRDAPDAPSEDDVVTSSTTGVNSPPIDAPTDAPDDTNRSLFDGEDTSSSPASLNKDVEQAGDEHVHDSLFHHVHELIPDTAMFSSSSFPPITTTKKNSKSVFLLGFVIGVLGVMAIMFNYRTNPSVVSSTSMGSLASVKSHVSPNQKSAATNAASGSESSQASVPSNQKTNNDNSDVSLAASFSSSELPSKAHHDKGETGDGNGNIPSATNNQGSHQHNANDTSGGGATNNQSPQQQLPSDADGGDASSVDAEEALTKEKEEELYKELGLDKFCFECEYGHAGFSCGYRVQWVMNKYGISEIEAMKANLGSCMGTVEEKVQEIPEEDLEALAELEKVFCGECGWRTQKFSCNQRVEYLMNTYHISKLEAMNGTLEDCRRPVDRTLRGSVENQQ